jgi:hypothetical protein
MTASSVVGKGSTFTFTMRFNLPTEADRPEVMPLNNSVIKEKQMDTDIGWPGQKSVGPKEQGETGMANVSLSPGFYAGLERHPHSTPVSSAGSSNPSIMVSQASLSSASSASTTPGSPIELELPAAETERRHHEKDEDESLRQLSKKDPVKPGVAVKARIYSVLVVCPLRWTREAITGHLNSVLDHIVPHTVCALSAGVMPCSPTNFTTDSISSDSGRSRSHVERPRIIHLHTSHPKSAKGRRSRQPV